MNRSLCYIVGVRCLILLLLLTMWEWAASTSSERAFLFGRPSEVIKDVYLLFSKERLLYHIAWTGAAAFSGVVLGTLMGAVVGLSFWLSSVVAEIGRPFVLILSSIPVIAFAPLMIIWFGIGFEMKVAVATLMTVFVALTQAFRGANLVAVEHVEVLKSMGARRGMVFFKVIVPGAMDWVLAALRLNVGLGLMGVFVGEFIAADRGVGYLLIRAAGLYDVNRAFACGLGLVLLAFTFDRLAMRVEANRFRLVQFLSVPRKLWSA